jgi:Flp pilus assembly protein TadB
MYDNARKMGGSVDIIATDKAIDLYAAEMKRRIEGLEKTIKEKDQTINKQKERQLACAVIFLLGLFFMMIAVYIPINNAWCE